MSWDLLLSFVFYSNSNVLCVHLSVHLCNFQGPTSKNPLSFKWYNPEEEILGKKMKVGLHLYSKWFFFIV
jgi:xylose isomerase